MSDPGRGAPDIPGSLQPQHKPGARSTAAGSELKSTAPGTRKHTVVVLHTDTAPGTETKPMVDVGCAVFEGTG